MNWYWYLRKEYEIFVDLDGTDPDSYAKKLYRANRRLRGAIDAGRIKVESAYLYHSSAALHHHLIIKMPECMSVEVAQVWALYLGSDVFRACNNLLRRMSGPVFVTSADLLISPAPYPNFYRRYDYNCECKAKHTRPIMETCPVGVRLRKHLAGMDFFGKPANPEPWAKSGRVYPE